MLQALSKKLACLTLTGQQLLNVCYKMTLVSLNFLQIAYKLNFWINCDLNRYQTHHLITQKTIILQTDTLWLPVGKQQLRSNHLKERSPFYLSVSRDKKVQERVYNICDGLCVL